MTEDYVHVAMRQYLKDNGWLLIAGEFPGGTDDELNVLSISDPEVMSPAKRKSPIESSKRAGTVVK